MAKSSLQFSCPGCKKAFTGKGNDFSRNKTNKSFPLIINCGHSVCRGCAESSANEKKYIICPTCQEKTALEEGETSVNLLLSDLYVLGRLAAKEVGLNLDIKKYSTGSYNASNSESSSKVMCDECSHSGAVWRCDKCVANFCNVCFDLVHKSSRLMKKHEGKPIFVESYRTEVQEGCSEHDYRPIEFYCEDDEQLACSYCVVLGRHKDHSVVTLAEKNKACSDKLKVGIEEGMKIQNSLQKTEKHLSKILPDRNVGSNQQYGRILDEFHRLHSFLQLREAELLAELDNILNRDTETLQEMRQKVSDQNKEISAIIKDAQQALNNSLILMNVSDVIKKLNSLQNIPCYLVVSNEEKSELKLDFDSDIVDKVKSYGRLQSNYMPKYALKKEEELPPDYEEPEDDVTADTESLTSTSDAPLEDIQTPNGINLNSPPHYTPVFETLKHENVYVTHIHHPSQFWVQRSNDIRRLKGLVDSINKWCYSEKSETHVPSTLTVGEMYLVQFEVDNNWYRARIKRIIEPASPQDQIKTVDNDPGSIMAEVFYIDYGNTEVVPLKRFREMQPRFLHLEGFATECSLWDIVPNNDEKEWTKNAVKIFASFVANRELLMLIVEKQGNVLHVDLSHPGEYGRGIKNDLPVSVRDALVFMEVACFVSGNSSEKSKLRSPLSKVRMRQFYPPEPLPVGKRINALLCHAVNPQHFYIQQMGINARYLSNLIFNMQKQYSSSMSNDSHLIYVPKKGMICVCQYSLDKQWYRAQVIDLPGGAKVEVLYVDYGNTEVVLCKSLRKIMDDFTKLPCQAIKCSLVDIAPLEGNEWSEESTAWFTDIARKKELSLHIHKITPGAGTAEVTLYYNKESVDVCVNGLIVKEAFAKSTGPESTVIEVPLSSTTTVAATTMSHKVIYCKAATIAREKKEKPAVKHPQLTQTDITAKVQDEAKQKGYFAINVSHADSPDCIYLHRIEQKEQLERMMNDMQKVYYQSQSEKLEICEGKPYAVAHPMTKRWYRGHIIKILENKFAQVNFVDYGFTDLVDVSTIQPLQSPFVDEIVFGIRCRLDGIVPAGGSKWSHMACEALKTLLSSVDVLYLQCTDKPVEDCTFSVELFIKEIISNALEVTSVKYKSISEMLIEKGVALPKDRLKRKANLENTDGDTKSSPEERAAHENKTSSESCTPTPALTQEPIIKVPVTAKNRYIMMSSWKPPTDPEKSSFTSIPSHVGVDGCIYFHIQGQGNLDLIKGALQMKVQQPGIIPPVEYPSVGEACIAKFCLDDKWYRAVVAKVEPPDIEVVFVDYGNVEIVPLTDIRMEVVLGEFPCQAFECLLYGIEPLSEDGVWPTATLDFIHNSIVEHPCTMTIVKKGTPEERLQVKIELPGGIDIADVLVDTRVAKRIPEEPKELADTSVEKTVSEQTKEPPTELAVKSISEECAQELDTKEMEETANLFTPAKLPPIDVLFPVVITQVLDYNMVYLQRQLIINPKTENEKLINQEVENFLLMMANLSEKADEFPQVKNVEAGKAYCGKYTYDESWYRCITKEVMADAAVVIYIDYGNSETLPLESLRELPEEYLQLPHQAVMCKIQGIERVGNELKDESFLSTASVFFPNKGTLMARVTRFNSPVEIDLMLQLEDEEPKLAYQNLIDCGLFKLGETVTEQQEISTH